MNLRGTPGGREQSRTAGARRWSLALVVLCVTGGVARAQQPAQPPEPPQVQAQAGLRLAAGQVAIVGGNAAGARERALDAALRQAVEQALGEILDAQTRAVQARAIKTLEGRARTFIKRYRTLEEGEAGGQYNVRIEAEVDEAALRRATERWTPAMAGQGTARASTPSMLVVAAGVAGVGPALVKALATLGIKAQLGDPSLTDPARALAAASRATLTSVLFVSASVTDEGSVRGPGKEAVSCRVTAKLLSAPTGQPLGQQNAATRVFGDRAEAARADCLDRAAIDVAAQLRPGTVVAAADAADLRTITLDADIVEPAAVTALLKVLRGLGSVSSAELRRIAAGRTEVRVRTRLPAPALATALSRDTGAVITLADVETLGDIIRVRVRLRPVPPPATTSAPAAPFVPGATTAVPASPTVP